MRLFVAVEIDPAIRERIHEFVSGLRATISEARWVRPEGLHITLKFLGNVADERRMAIENALRSVREKEVTLSLKQLGVFPNPRSPRVLWVGIAAGPELDQLAMGVDQQMGSVGFETELISRWARLGSKPKSAHSRRTSRWQDSTSAPEAILVRS